MLLARVTAALAALVMLLATAFVLDPPSQAAGKPRHDVVAKGYEKGDTDRFFVRGRVTTFPKGRIKILRNVSGGPFKVYKKTKTRRTGKFRAQIFQVGNKKTCFKVQVPASPVYRKTTTPNIGCITTT